MSDPFTDGMIRKPTTNRKQALQDALEFADAQHHGPPGFWNDLRVLADEVRRLERENAAMRKVVEAARNVVE